MASSEPAVNSQTILSQPSTIEITPQEQQETTTPINPDNHITTQDSNAPSDGNPPEAQPFH